MGAITVRRVSVGKMSAGVLFLGLAAFLVAFLHPAFALLAWPSLFGGLLVAGLLWRRQGRSSHPTVSHLAQDPEEGKPIEPR